MIRDPNPTELLKITHSRETYQPTSIMRWDRGISNGATEITEIRFCDGFSGSGHGNWLPASRWPVVVSVHTMKNVDLSEAECLNMF